MHVSLATFRGMQLSETSVPCGRPAWAALARTLVPRHGLLFFILCYFGTMAVPQDFEVYGAAQRPVRTTSRNVRIALVAAAVTLCMVVAIISLVGGPANTSPIEDVAVTPETKLKHLVTKFAENINTMSLAEMENQLEAWRSNPDTILDLPEKSRTQVIRDMYFPLSIFPEYTEN